jgi:hypothetical protein
LLPMNPAPPVTTIRMDIHPCLFPGVSTHR